MKFLNRVAVITGASTGIGYATAIKLAGYGTELILIDIDKSGLEKAAEECRRIGSDVLIYECDISDEMTVGKTVDDIIVKKGRIDILINNAGIYRDNRVPFIESVSAQWRRKIDVNILGTMYMTKAVLPRMIEQKYGRIVNLSSIAGVYGLPNNVDYSMTKGAIIAFTQALSKEVAGLGILVNAVSPGTIGPTPDPARFNYSEREGSPEECAEVICFLASDNASYVSGQNYIVDGGRKTI